MKAGEDLAEQFSDDIIIHIPSDTEWRLMLKVYVDIGLFELHLGHITFYSDDDEDEDGDDDEEDRLDFSQEMGHWDQARWAPWCLRWEELESIVKHIRSHPQPPASGITPDVALLLLSRFVGHGSGDAEQALLETRRGIVADAFVRSRIFPDTTSAAVMAKKMILPVPENDYEWKKDEEKGWTLSGSYDCYSKRNCHRFPFEELREFREAFDVVDE